MSNYLTFRTYHKGQYGYCGLEYAKLYPQHLTPEALEQFMGRTPGTKNKPRTPAIASNLLEALNFISVAATKDIQPINTHVQLGEGFAIMYDGQITAGYPIEEELDCLPNYELFLKAIKKCGNSLALTQLDGDRLSVVGEKLKATIPCLDAGAASGTRPDPPVCVVDDRLKTAMAVCSVLASEQASRVLEASLLLKAYDCTGTNGASIIQFYHGFDLPPNLVVPCIFAKAVAKTKQPITAFGYSYNADMQKFTSITFYFEGGMWIKTQLYQDEWPDIARIIDVPFQSFELPSGLFEGIEAVSDFNEHGNVMFKDNEVSSSDPSNKSAQYEVKGLQGGKEIKYDIFNKLIPFIKNWDYTSYPDRIYFTGENIRGCLMCIIAKVN